MGKDDNRNLTDADVEAITEALREKVIMEFYRDLGRGVWGLVWRAIVMAMIAIAAFGAVKEFHQ
jgi:hypothetical protein